MSFQSYPKYKDSGVEWLGEVPEGWEVQPIKTVASCNDDVLGESTDEDYELEYVEISDVDVNRGITGSTLYRFQEAPSRARRQVKDGDVIVSTVRTYLRAIAPVHNPPENLIVSTGFAVIRPQSVLSGFIGYFFLSEYLMAEVISRSVGVSYPAINASQLMQLVAALPPQAEQQTIAAFLDRETAKIDALVAEQENLIALLKEKRQAVISHAVTKGLDPTVPMKDSGIEWLGEVPAHWDVVRLRNVANIVRGASPRPAGDPRFFSVEPETTDYLPWLTVAEITKDHFSLVSSTEKYLTPLGIEQSQIFTQNTLVLSNSGATLGVPKILGMTCCANDGVLAFKELSASVEIMFVYYFLSSLTARLREYMKNGAQPNLNTDVVKDIGFPLPDLMGQQEIVAYLDTEILKLDDLTTEAQHTIDLLKERRSALISAAVTGKIDVRGVI